LNMVGSGAHQMVSSVVGDVTVFVWCPPANSNTDCLLPDYCYIRPRGGCTTPCSRCVQPLRGLRWAVQAAMVMSLWMVSFGSVLSKETLASMALLPCYMVWCIMVALTSPLALPRVSDMVMY
jgi:hypothetical protein